MPLSDKALFCPSLPFSTIKNPPFQTDCGGLYWTRTSDPIDVNDVLYQLSQQTSQFLLPIFVHFAQFTFLVHNPLGGEGCPATKIILPCCWTFVNSQIAKSQNYLSSYKAGANL